MGALYRKLPSSAFHDLDWRALQNADAGVVGSLVDLCLKSDAGYIHGLSSMDDDTDAFIRKYYMPATAGVSTGTFDAEGRLIAFASANPVETAEEYRASIVGHVHPDFRNRGIGTYLITWSIAEGSRILEYYPADRPHVLQIRSESLTGSASRIFEQLGFEQRFAEDIMRRDLRNPVPIARFPEGVKLETWASAIADQFYAVYRDAYQTRPGFVLRSKDEWTSWMDTEGEGFRSHRSMIALHNELPIGFICCDDEWIIQIGVVPKWRGKKIGSSLMREALKRFRDAGADFVMLHVNVNNPTARQMYSRCGFECVGRRARYVKML